MVTPNTDAAADYRFALTGEAVDADALRTVATADGVAPLLRSALGSLIDLAGTTRADGYENHFTDAAVNGAARVQSNTVALIVARALVERLQADLTAAAADQEKYLRDELARFEQMQLE
jgi:hypothetical protein